MKLYRTILLAVLAVTPLMVPGAVLADNWSVSVSVGQVNDFYEPLARHGYWVEIPSYGRCWYPAYVEHDWRPYTEGYWLWTDDGWYWESTESWAWATYHYGRWTLDPYYGWVWVPDTVWGPAWVSWRGGGEYVGWAPLPPRCGFGPDGWLMADRVVIAPQWFVFVQYGHFCESIHRRHVIINQTIVNQTVNITKIRQVNHTTIINNGPDLDVVRKHVGHQLEARPVSEIRQAETEWRKERGSLGHARVKLPSPILPVTEEQGREGRNRHEATVVPPVTAPEPRSEQEMKHKASQPALPAETAKPAPEHGKPKGNEFIEKGAEKPSKPPREEVRIPEATRPSPAPMDVIVPRSEQPREPRQLWTERNEGAERPDRGVRNTPIGNYGNFPIGKAYAKPSGGSRSAPEVVQPQTSGGRMSGPEDLHGRNPDRRDRD